MYTRKKGTKGNKKDLKLLCTIPSIGKENRLYCVYQEVCPSTVNRMYILTRVVNVIDRVLRKKRTKRQGKVRNYFRIERGVWQMAKDQQHHPVHNGDLGVSACKQKNTEMVTSGLVQK